MKGSIVYDHERIYSLKKREKKIKNNPKIKIKN